MILRCCKRIANGPNRGRATGALAASLFPFAREARVSRVIGKKAERMSGETLM